MLRIAKIVVIYKKQYRRKHQQIFMLQWIYILPTFAAMSCQGPALPVVLRKCGERREWGMQSLLFFQDNAACFPFIRHEILCPLCLFTFTIPIINSKIATLATNDMWPYSQFSMSGLAGLRAAAFILTFTHWESKWGEGVVICSWDIRDLWPATHQISILFYYRK